MEYASTLLSSQLNGVIMQAISSSPFHGMERGERLNTNAFRGKQFQKTLFLSQPSVLHPTHTLKLFSYGSFACTFPPPQNWQYFLIPNGIGRWLLIAKYFCVVYDYAGKNQILARAIGIQKKIGSNHVFFRGT